MNINLSRYISKIVILSLLTSSYSYTQLASMSNAQPINICTTFHITCVFHKDLTLQYLEMTALPNKEKSSDEVPTALL